MKYQQLYKSYQSLVTSYKKYGCPPIEYLTGLEKSYSDKFQKFVSKLAHKVYSVNRRLTTL